MRPSPTAPLMFLSLYIHLVKLGSGGFKPLQDKQEFEAETLLTHMYLLSLLLVTCVVNVPQFGFFDINKTFDNMSLVRPNGF